MATQHIRYKLRGYTAAQWTTANPILLEREPGIETDTRKVKYGDGVTAWNSLAYSYTGSGGGGSVATDAIFDAKGDLAVGTGADTAAKLTVGANDTILMADSAQTTGAKWGNPATVKTALSLNNVDNVADASKPVSTLQAAADAVVLASAIQRANHTGTQLASTVSDFADTVRSTVLTGLSLVTNQAIAATDTVLQAFGYIQKQITDLIATVATKAKLNTSASDPTGTFSADELHCNTTSGQLFWASDANTSRQVFLSGINTIGTSDIAAGAVTLAKQADMATASVVYRKTAGTGAPEVNTLATLKTDLGLTGTNSGDQTSVVGITGTKAQFDTACSDGNFAYQSDIGSSIQAYDADLATIAGLTATTDSFIQAKGSAWAARTVAQVKTDLGLSNTNSGDQTTIVGITGTTAQFNTALSDNDFATLAGTESLSAKIITVTGSHGTDDTYEGIAISGKLAGAAIAQWETVYLDGSSTWQLADANGSSTYPARGVAVAAYSSTNAAIVLKLGTVRNDAWTWTPGGNIYLSTTAGGLTQTAPSTSGDKVQVVGFALDADRAFFDFAPTYLTVT